VTTIPLLSVPAGAKSAVIFDTNAYRELTAKTLLVDTRKRAINLRALERGSGCVALASPIVIWELVAHLADPSDPAYERCQNALVALGEHTRDLSGTGGIMMALDSEWLVCHTLFGKTPPGAETNVKNLAALANHVRDNAPSISDPVVLANMKVFSQEMARREGSWLADLQNALDGLSTATSHLKGQAKKNAEQQLRAYLQSPEFATLWALLGVHHHAQLVSASLTDQEWQSMADFFEKEFSVPFRLTLTLVRNLMGQPGLNLTSAKRKRGNFMWDAGICYMIPAAQQAGVPIEIVSGDHAIVTAAAQCGNAVIGLDHYLQRIGLP
jgi:hypothetical protein